MSCPGAISILGWTPFQLHANFNINILFHLLLTPTHAKRNSTSTRVRMCCDYTNTEEKRTLKRTEYGNSFHLHKTFQNSCTQGKCVTIRGYEGQSVCIEWSKRNLNPSGVFTAFMYRHLHKYNIDKMFQYKSTELKAHICSYKPKFYGQILLKLNFDRDLIRISLEKHFEA